MLLSSKGIVLQSINYGDNSIISKVFSEEKGIVSLIHSKKRGKRKGQSNYFLPLAAIQFVCYLSNKSNIYRIKEISFNENVPPPGESVISSSIRFFLAEFLCKTIKEEEQNISLYAFLEKKVCQLELDDNSLPSFHIRFLTELLEPLGIYPELDQEDLFFDFREGQSVAKQPFHTEFCTKEGILLIDSVLNDKVLLTRFERKKCLDILLEYYQVQLEVSLENLKSKNVLEVVFS